MAFSQSLADYQWKNRILVLVAKTENSSLLAQRKSFSTLKKELVERDLVLLELSSDKKELKERFDISERFEGVLLIGKDGGLKLKKQFFVDPKDVFALIDSMPMRRAEMRKN
ncbi:DUF4174 domain-containing protein [Muricauda sp. DJ-13]|uniref:DUF4174 domain-containing protein n=2 Tax=Croceivirga thetidis TaxID=2721623 RepID=A0ABX1GUJ2_9FLAO|nr:DUF4174 domain-containing protein [Croceivirga thetidis]